MRYLVKWAFGEQQLYSTKRAALASASKIHTELPSTFVRVVDLLSPVDKSAYLWRSDAAQPKEA